MPKRRPYFETLDKVLVNETAEYVEATRVAPGETLYVTAGALEDETTAPTTISFGKKVGTRFEAMEEEPSPLLGIRYHLEKTHRFDAGDIPAFRVEVGVADDKLSGYLEGYIKECP